MRTISGKKSQKIKRFAGFAAVVLAAGIILTMCSPALHILYAMFDESQAVHINPDEIENSTLAIGTHLVYLSALDDEIYSLAVQTAEDSGQTELYYKSELGDGAWYAITSAGSLEDITQKNGRIDNQVIKALFFTYHTRSDGITYDLRTNEAVNTFDIVNPYNLEDLPELESLRNQMQRLKNGGADIKLLEEFFDTNGNNGEGSEDEKGNENEDGKKDKGIENEKTKTIDEKMAGLYEYEQRQIAAGISSDKLEMVKKAMEKVDAARRSEANRILIERLNTLMNQVSASEKLSVHSDLMSAIGDCLKEVQASKDEQDGKRLYIDGEDNGNRGTAGNSGNGENGNANGNINGNNGSGGSGSTDGNSGNEGSGDTDENSGNSGSGSTDGNGGNGESGSTDGNGGNGESSSTDGNSGSGGSGSSDGNSGNGGSGSTDGNGGSGSTDGNGGNGESGSTDGNSGTDNEDGTKSTDTSNLNAADASYIDTSALSLVEQELVQELLASIESGNDADADSLLDEMVSLYDIIDGTGRNPQKEKEILDNRLLPKAKQAYEETGSNAARNELEYYEKLRAQMDGIPADTLELNSLYDEKLKLKEQFMSALDKNDQTQAQKLEALIADVDSKIQKLEADGVYGDGSASQSIQDMKAASLKILQDIIDKASEEKRVRDAENSDNRGDEGNMDAGGNGGNEADTEASGNGGNEADTEAGGNGGNEAGTEASDDGANEDGAETSVSLSTLKLGSADVENISVNLEGIRALCETNPDMASDALQEIYQKLQAFQVMGDGESAECEDLLIKTEEIMAENLPVIHGTMDADAIVAALEEVDGASLEGRDTQTNTGEKQDSSQKDGAGNTTEEQAAGKATAEQAVDKSSAEQAADKGSAEQAADKSTAKQAAGKMTPESAKENAAALAGIAMFCGQADAGADSPAKVLLSSKAEMLSAQAGSYVFRNLTASPGSSYAPADKLAAFCSYRYVWKENQKKAILAQGNKYYEFTAFSNDVKQAKGEKSKLESAALFQSVVYLPADYIEQEFSCQVYDLSDTGYSVLLDTDIADKASKVCDAILEKGGNE